MTEEGLLIQTSQESFNHDVKGENMGGKADHLGKMSQIFEPQ